MGPSKRTCTPMQHGRHVAEEKNQCESLERGSSPCMSRSHTCSAPLHACLVPPYSCRQVEFPSMWRPSDKGAHAHFDGPIVHPFFFKVVINLVDAHQQLSSRNDRIKSMGCTFKTIYSHRPKCSSHTSKVNRYYI